MTLKEKNKKIYLRNYDLRENSSAITRLTLILNLILFRIYDAFHLK